ncbi:MAG: hypothetical protein K9K79_05480, partial [Desulfohalobiaceae bacterium]|nr:hypothetical protein [Desulfohalobiaceae bacterium]
RTSDTGQTNGDRSRYSNVFDQLGEPYGELGLVTQQDRGFWQDQSGPPTDPQAGNIPGGRRDILRTADFDNRSMDAFSKDVGVFTPTGGQLEISSETPEGQAAAVFMLDDYLPSYYEVMATFNLDKPTGGWKANGYVIFDYYSDIDFKFAGINVSNNQIEMGYRDASGWHILAKSNKPVKIKAMEDHTVTVAVNGNNVTVAVAGVNWFTYDYTPRYDAMGDPIPLNGGMVGVGMDGSSGRMDNFTVQVLPPEWTLDQTDDFMSPAEFNRIDKSGNWEEASGILTGTADEGGPAVQLIDLGAALKANSHLEMEAEITTAGTAGFVFDRYDDQNYKFVALNVANNQVVIGHAKSRGGVAVEASFAYDLDPDSTHRFKVTMQGAGLGVSVDGAPVTSYSFNAALVDGGFGLMTMDGAAVFSELTVRTDDPAFAAPEGDPMMAASAPEDTGEVLVDLTYADLDPITAAAVERWTESPMFDEEMLGRLDAVTFLIADLEGDMLALAVDDTVIIDVDAAGHGWFVDDTPYDDAEFITHNNAEELTASEESGAYGDMDLLSVVMHELGHVFGYEDVYTEDNQTEIMNGTLDEGVRYLPEDSFEYQARNGSESLISMNLTPDESSTEKRIEALVRKNHWIVHYLQNCADYNNDPNSDLVVVIKDEDLQNTGEDSVAPPSDKEGKKK